MNTIKVNSSIVKETEKAYQLDVQYWTSDNNPIKKATMWVPKSQCTVENGQVTEIADWILNRWVEDRNNYMRNAGHSYSTKYSPCFNMAEYDRIHAAKKAKQEAYKDELNHTLEVTAKFVKPYADLYMSQLAHDALFIYEHYKDSGILTSEFLEALRVIGEKIAHDFGSSMYEAGLTKKNMESWLNTFTEKYTTFESIRDYLHYMIYERRGVYNFNFYNSEFAREIKFEDGQPVTENMIYTILQHGAADPSTSLLGKKFKKNWEYYNEFKNLVETMF